MTIDAPASGSYRCKHRLSCPMFPRFAREGKRNAPVRNPVCESLAVVAPIRLRHLPPLRRGRKREASVLNPSPACGGRWRQPEGGAPCEGIGRATPSNGARCWMRRPVDCGFLVTAENHPRQRLAVESVEGISCLVRHADLRVQVSKIARFGRRRAAGRVEALNARYA
jgi:hypothetical protein